MATLVAAASLLVAGSASGQRQAGGSRAAHRAQPERRIIVSVPDRKLALVEDGRVVKTYRVAVGTRESPSPTGVFRIINRLEAPGYYAPGVVIPPGRDNPLGPRWLGLSLKGYGIHGTNQPESIGHSASHGCIRLSNPDIRDLFARVRTGDVVKLYGERTPELAASFGEDAPAKSFAARVAVATALHALPESSGSQ